jgi:hypothetical protein
LDACGNFALKAQSRGTREYSEESLCHRMRSKDRPLRWATAGGMEENEAEGDQGGGGAEEF